MNNPLVLGSSVSRVFGRGPGAVVALREATFEILSGDQIAVVGPSGSGKSTLLHLIAGLDRPTSGRLEWPALGSVATLRPTRVSVSFQGPSLLPPLSVEENVALPLLLAGAREEEARREARQLLDQLDLAPVATKLPEELSSGQAQRAALARALVGRPKLVLADEPTGQLDQVAAARTIDLLVDRVGELGAAVLVATHDPRVANRFPLHWSLDGRQLRIEVTRCSR
jgi:ABC-type lipoprotein export system ATPase subunit